MKHNSIAISGLPGSGKSSLAELLSVNLNWKIRTVGGIWRERHKQECPDIPFETYWKNTSAEENKAVNDALKYLVDQGRIIADARYVHMFGPKTFKVFVTAPLQVRAQRAVEIGKYYGKTLNEIEKILLDREQDELQMGKTIWGKRYDYRRLSSYNLVLNNGSMTPKEEFEVVYSVL